MKLKKTELNEREQEVVSCLIANLEHYGDTVKITGLQRLTENTLQVMTDYGDYIVNIYQGKPMMEFYHNGFNSMVFGI